MSTFVQGQERDEKAADGNRNRVLRARGDHRRCGGGRAPLEPALEVELKIQADGFAPGVAAMILASCQVQGATLSADPGQAETIITQLGFPPRESGDTPYVTRVFAGGACHRPVSSTSNASATAGTCSSRSRPKWCS